MQMTRLAAGATSVVLAVAALTACAARPGDGADPAAAPEPAATGAAGELAATAEVMGRAGNSRIRFHVAAEGLSTTGSGYAQWNGRPALQYFDGKQGTTRIVGGDLYYSFTADAAGQWSVLPREEGSPPPMHLSTLAMEHVADPVAELRRAARRADVTDRGTESVAGAPAQHFRSSSPLLPRSGGAGHGLFDGFADYRPPLGATCTADFWINERHELVRLTLTLSADEKRQEIEADYSEPGSAPEIAAPASATPML
ncbi:hypothetical protein [Streptomyces sp. TLI_053]|uniref:hypothetical protein n=1 Tax=Streptomyces sp. TLI_053 TaxID=1855352 RepID=UPI000B81B77C|nr:hypothetical protein [Streptomyces sp. TLI_053]